MASTKSDSAAPVLQAEANNALVDGVWQTDSSQHTLDGRLKGRDFAHGAVRIEARNGKPTLRVAYFFSGIERKASIADRLSSLCSAKGFGLEFHEVDTLVGGENHDLTKTEIQDEWIDRVENGDSTS